MKPFKRLIAAAALALASATSYAATDVYTSSASFLANVAGGAFFNDFDGLPEPPVGPVPFSNGTFSYSASAPTDIYLGGNFLGTNVNGEVLTITFTSGNVNAFGANFFNTDFLDDFQSTEVTITLSDGTIETLTPATFDDSYRGFVSSAFITSLTVSGVSDNWAGLDNFTVGQAIPPTNPVPEPASVLLLGAGLAGLLLARRRKA